MAKEQNVFKLSERSLNNLKGVHNDLVLLVRAAIKMSAVDFTVLEGLRSVSRQSMLVRSGASRTMNSRHITGHAVDLGAYVNGRVDWDFEYYFQIAEAMQKAAKSHGIPIVWGGVWDKPLNDYNDVRAEVEAYKERHAGKDFLDGPHFELYRKAYK